MTRNKKINMKEFMFRKEIMRNGKIVEIITFIFGLIVYFSYEIVGLFMMSLIAFDWIFSAVFENNKFGDPYYSWKCLFNRVEKEEIKDGI